LGILVRIFSVGNTHKEHDMARQMMKYRLTAEGTIPDFLYLGEDGVGGVYGVPDPSTPWPRDLVQVGITNDGATGDFEVIPTKADLLAYLTSVSGSWAQIDPAQPNNMEATIPFDPSAATDWAWGRLDALNA
jgi:hypothetical protein